MVIDFHTHTFPAKIAEGALRHLSDIAGGIIPHTSGTEDSLKESMKQNGITYSVMMPVATSKKQVTTINDHAIEINGSDGLYSFGGMHYEFEDYKSEFQRLKNAGIKGIKLHHDYMNLRFDDERSVEIMNAAFDLDLIILIHAGNDPVSKDIHYCTPKMIKETLPKLKEGKLIASHYGGLMNIEEVETYLLGENIYFDTSMAHHYYGLEKLRRILNAHSKDLILFGSDSPWESQGTSLALLHSMSLSSDLIDKITWENPARLLNIL
ncbi:MAG: amidohydrolase family protein [Clostridia bacterium]|nr:amidohydrolase family protein [Clostridia bacterium]